MPRQSITFTEPNNDWLEEQVASKEYTSKSELVNSLIRQARDKEIKIDFIREKILRAKQSGYSDKGLDDILSESRQRLQKKNAV